MLHNIGFFMLFKNFMQHKIAVLCNIKSRFNLHKKNDFMQHKFKQHFYAA